MNIMQSMRKGATFIEYAMLAGLVAVVVAVAALFFGDKLKALFKSEADKTAEVTSGVNDADIKPDTSKIK